MLRVMTFNIRGARFADGENIWPNRAALSAAVIRRHAPDLIGFQEFELPNYAFLRGQLPGYEHVLGPGYGNAPPFQYPAIFWRRDRLRLLDTGGFWLSTTPAVHSRAWETDCIRSAAWVRLELRGAGTHLLHLNTHLDHISELAREEGAKLIAARLCDLWADGAPAVVTGDFNCVPGSPAHATLLGAGLADTHSAVNSDAGPVMTFHGFRGRAFQPQWFDARDRIDWVLARGLRPVANTIVEDAEPPLYPSDHYPVVADLVL
ncbi:MAG TPA: endonuclease/exonuclease/phosphatase family protein [Roseiflexaceae bacterium]|nr:endonuclease/exonuclease/phosphatase family protein [Roseiflexaceae bacterium]